MLKFALSTLKLVLYSASCVADLITHAIFLYIVCNFCLDSPSMGTDCDQAPHTCLAQEGVLRLELIRAVLAVGRAHVWQEG